MTMIMRKSLPVRQDGQGWVELLTADPTCPNRWINAFSAATVTVFTILVFSILGVIVLGQFLINHQPPQYIGLSTLAFSAIVLLVLALIAFATLSILKILRPYLYSIIVGVTLAAFAVIATLFVFFVCYELVLWLVSPSNLPSSLSLADRIVQTIFH